MTKQTLHMKSPAHKEELHRGTALERSVEKRRGGEEVGGGGGRGAGGGVLKVSAKSALNSDAVPNYNHMFCPNSGPLPHQ